MALAALSRLRASGLRNPEAVWFTLGAIALLALALRATYLLRHLHEFRLAGDALNYQIMSWQWVEDGVYGYALKRKSGEPNAYVTPGYPVFLSAVYAVVRDPYLQITVARGVQALLGAASTILAFLVVRRMMGRADVALLTALFVALYPPYVQSPWQILTEVLALFTMLLYFWLQAAGLATGSRWYNLGAGVAFASQLLVRPVLLPLAPLPFVYVLVKRGWRRWPHVVHMGLWTAAGVLALMLPWWVRNLVVLDELVLTATGSANPLLAGTYPYLRGVLQDFQAAGLSSEDQGWFARQRLREGFSREPLLYLRWYTVGKIRMTFETPWLYEYLGARPRVQYAVHVSHLAAVGAGLAGLVVGAVRNGAVRFVLVYLALFTGLYLIFIPTTRYAYQLMFFLLFGAAYLACEIVRRAVRSLERRAQDQAN
jgi:4-amino-4-deoxy-L-arabinose transferase-like glycosyltransferase